MNQGTVSVYCPPVDCWPQRERSNEFIKVVEVCVDCGQVVEHGSNLLKVQDDDEAPAWSIKLSGFQGVVESLTVTAGDVIGPNTLLLKLLVNERSLRNVSTQFTLLGAATTWAIRIRTLAKKELDLRRRLGLQEYEVVPSDYFDQEENEVFRRFEQHTLWFLERYLEPSLAYAATHRLQSNFDPQTRDELLAELHWQIRADWNRGAVLLAWESAKDISIENEPRSFRKFFRKRVEFNLRTVIKKHLAKWHRHVNIDDITTALDEKSHAEEASPDEESSVFMLLRGIHDQIENWIHAAMKTRGEKAAVRMLRWMELAKSDFKVSDQVQLVVQEGLYPSGQAAERDRRRQLKTVIAMVAQNLEFLPMSPGSDDVLSAISAAVNYVFLENGYRSISYELILNSLADEYGANAIVG